MTVEQRITTQGSDAVETTIISPGERLKSTLVKITPTHPHIESEVIFSISCADDDSHGRVVFFDPDAPEDEPMITDNRFTNSLSPYYIIRKEDGRLGKIEWEHKSSRRTLRMVGPDE